MVEGGSRGFDEREGMGLMVNRGLQTAKASLHRAGGRAQNLAPTNVVLLESTRASKSPVAIIDILMCS